MPDSGHPPRILTTSGYAYLKIAEGCSRKCRYCTIPAIRGPLTSVDPAELETEARFLASLGVRELVLVAQDLTSYGRDRGERNALAKLLDRVQQVEAIKWIRLMYLHPDGITAGCRESHKRFPHHSPLFGHSFSARLRHRASSHGTTLEGKPYPKTRRTPQSGYPWAWS